MGASASTVASAFTASQSYHVFINHKGDDVKESFARSLCLRLHDKGLRAFLDITEMQPGYNFFDQIEHAIKTATVHVAIFSPNYANSPWCLDELVWMLQSNTPIVPVFYRVRPADLRWKKGKYAENLKHLASKTNDNGTPRHHSDTIENWRKALSSVSYYPGFELENRSGEELGLELLDKVVECLSKMVKTPDLYVAKYPTGLDDKMSDFENTVLLQQPESGKPQIVGITGLGGVGKSTLAKQFFNRKKSDYPKSCFLSDIKDASLTLLQTQLLKDLAGIDKPIHSVDEGKEMLIEHLKPSESLTRSHNPVDGVDAAKEMPTKHLESSKTLIVLDDVDHEDQVRAFLPLEALDFLAGSLILITSRNKDVLIRARVAIPSIYLLTGLNTKYSEELFCSHAFNQAYPPQVFQDLTERFVKYCNGLPLSLKVIGAHLYGKEISEWEDELGSFPSEVKGSLKISYDALDPQEQQIFLDIACFLSGQNRDTAINIWNASGWKGRRGFQNLQDRGLVEVDSSNLIHMHDHLRELGREIGEKTSPFRLWRWTEDVIGYLLLQPSGKLMVRGLKMDRSDCNNYGDYVLGHIGTMRLRFIDTEYDVMDRILGMVKSPGMERILWLRWRNCPYSSLPSWVSVKNLRHLDVSESDLNTLWQTENQSQVPLQLAEFLEELITDSCLKLKSISGLEHTRKLRLLDVRWCCELEELSMETLTSLEEFCAAGCVKLKRISGLEQCTKLRLVNVGDCSKLEELPWMETLTSLEEFHAFGCAKVKVIRGLEQCTKLRKLHVGGCSELEELPRMETLTSLEEFQAYDCVKVDVIRGLEAQGLPDSAGEWKSLQLIDLGGCSSLKQLPDSAGNWKSLQWINLGGCSSLKQLPDSAGNWKSLQWINLGGCSNLEKLPHSAGHWTSLQRIDLGEYSPQKPLHLAYNWKSKGLPESMEKWRHLKYSHVGSSALLYASSISNYVYDVFINCHGPDVKRTFASHLNQRLVSGQLRPFLDEYERHEEDNIATQIKEVIATASVHVVIFSPQYAESRRCLDELLLILNTGAPVIAVFYKVRSCNLQWTKDKVGVYGRALQNREKRTTYDSQTNENKPPDNSNTIEEWRKALSYISGPGISGFELQAFKGDEAELLNGVAGVYGRALQNHEKRTRYDSQTSEDKPRDNSNTKALSNISGVWIRGFELQSFNGDEAKLLDAVVESVFRSVRKAPFYEVGYLKDLDQMVEDFEKTVLLHRQSGKPRVLGIVGEASVGKTTLAKELSNRKSSSFNRACILFDVSGTVARGSLHLLQEKLFKCLTNMDIQIESVDQGIGLFEKHASSVNYGATAFVILDNVDEVDQLKALLPVQNCLPGESLILITSRFKNVLEDFGVEQSSIYHLTDPLSDKRPSCLDRTVKKFADTIPLPQPGEKAHVVGIVGIGGIGKTRLAMEFFNRKRLNYMRSYFFYDVNETARRSYSLHNLLSKLLQGLTHLDLQVEGMDEGINLFTEHVSSFPSLVILDNVVHWHQLHALLSVLSVLHSDSLILITCREEEVLKCSGVQESSIYKLNRLDTKDSRELFCTHAFGQPRPRQGFQALADKFLTACNGLPLTLKVFGALLRRKDKSSWQTQFNKLRRIRPDHIEKRLQLCYDDLDEEKKEIFLHIACCCIGEERGLAVRLWDASGSIGSSVFENLQKRCLVDVDSEDCLFMHEYLRELGRSIADEKGLRGRKGPRQSSNERVITELGRSDGDLSQQ